VIVGIGVDIVQVNRMERWVNNAKLLERFFHKEEINPSFSTRKKSTQNLAARFAAKEAFGKALGSGLADLSLKDIMVINQDNGKPEIKLFGTAAKALEKSGAVKVHISLTHERDYAVAVIVLEGA